MQISSVSEPIRKICAICVRLNKKFLRKAQVLRNLGLIFF